MSAYDYGDVILLFEVRGLVGKEGVPNNVSDEFYTSEGMIRGGKFYPKSVGDAVSIKGEGRKVTSGGDPFAAFTTAMRSRRPEDNNADAETAHLSAALCHLGNISYRLGTMATFDKQTKSLGDNKQVVESFENIRENLKAVDVQLDGLEYTVGRQLTFDPVAEKFVGDDEANALLTRNYRKPFNVPDEA